MRPPWWRRWLLRLIALMALGGVALGLVTIVQKATEDGRAAALPLEAELIALAKAGETLGDRLDALDRGDPRDVALASARAARAAQRSVVAALRERQAHREDTPEEGELQDALGAESAWLEAVGSVLGKRDSPLLRTLGDRGERAIDAWAQLDNDHGVGATIHGVASLKAWAKNRRSG